MKLQKSVKKSLVFINILVGSFISTIICQALVGMDFRYENSLPKSIPGPGYGFLIAYISFPIIYTVLTLLFTRLFVQNIKKFHVFWSLLIPLLIILFSEYILNVPLLAFGIVLPVALSSEFFKM